MVLVLLLVLMLQLLLLLLRLLVGRNSLGCHDLIGVADCGRMLVRVD